MLYKRALYFRLREHYGNTTLPEFPPVSILWTELLVSGFVFPFQVADLVTGQETTGCAWYKDKRTISLRDMVPWGGNSGDSCSCHWRGRRIHAALFAPIMMILLCTQTDEQHGQAWGQFTFTGHVRTSDGWITLCRKPVYDSVLCCPGLSFTGLLGVGWDTWHLDIWGICGCLKSLCLSFCDLRWTMDSCTDSILLQFCWPMA